MKLFGDKGKFSVFEKGLKKSFNEEPSVRVLTFFLLVTIAIAFRYENNYVRRVLLILASLAIFNSELTNTAIEAVVDRISLERHELSGYAKDLASSTTILWVFFGIYVWGEWLYHQWSRRNNEKNIFNKPLDSVIFIAAATVLVFPLLYILHMVTHVLE